MCEEFSAVTKVTVWFAAYDWCLNTQTAETERSSSLVCKSRTPLLFSLKNGRLEEKIRARKIYLHKIIHCGTMGMFVLLVCELIFFCANTFFPMQALQWQCFLLKFWFRFRCQWFYFQFLTLLSLLWPHSFPAVNSHLGHIYVFFWTNDCCLQHSSNTDAIIYTKEIPCNPGDVWSDDPAH